MAEPADTVPSLRAPRPDRPRRPWWHRGLPSFLVFVVVILVVGVATVAVGTDVVDVLPEVGKDHLGADEWKDPIGIENADGLLIAHLPDCAAGAVTRIALWDAESNPFWEVSGPAKPLTAFVIGFTPKGFQVVKEYEKPKPGTVLRLVVFRKVGGVAGIRFQQSQLRKGRVVSGNPLARYTIDGFQEAKVCPGASATTGTEVGTGGDSGSGEVTPTTAAG